MTKVVKDMARQRLHCEASIARGYSEHVRGSDNICSPRPVSLDTCCRGYKRDKFYTETDPDVTELLRQMVRDEYNGADLDPTTNWTVHRVAHVNGVSFTSGDPLMGVRRKRWKMKRCGSVITLVTGGRSLYAWVIQFLRFDRLHVAHVRWFPVPDYPTGTPVVVRLRAGNPLPPLPCVISLTEIDPSKIILMPENNDYYPIRMTGIDTMPTV